ncbi:hypothetical protein EalM132_00038 [Exiguobacterium phage vB_EalM-132]|nr:hypothetical protein EalM132_00038 [Exiguobacterium phage vB_EalM-132]
MKYPLNQCSDCTHRNGCDLLSKIRFWANRNDFIDMSDATCKSYQTDYYTPEDLGWKNLMEPTPNKAYDISYEELSENEYFLALEDALMDCGLAPDYIIVSTEFVTNLIPDRFSGTNLRLLELFGIPIEINDTLGTRFIIQGEDMKTGEMVALAYDALEDEEDGD